MPRTLLENSRIWQAGRFIAGHTLVIEAGIIRALRPQADIRPCAQDRRIDAGAAYALPGFIDLHVHGSLGYDVMDAEPDRLRKLGDFLLRQGVTSYLGTTMSDSRERITAALAAMQVVAAEPHGPLLGVHLEGPYLNPAYRGSQPARYLRLPEPAEYAPWLETGLLRLITIAPELPGGEQLLQAALRQGCTVAIGHSAASYVEAAGYFARGLGQVTHTFNGMPGIHHRAPGLFLAAWEAPQVQFQIIADGLHVHPAVLRMLLQLAGVERVLAITDAMRAAGMADGQYRLGDIEVTVRDGNSRGPEGKLAGSTLTMTQALRNLMCWCNLSLAEALPMFTSVPAHAIHMYPQKGSLQIGSDADIVLWDEAAGVRGTIIGGELVYAAPGISRQRRN